MEVIKRRRKWRKICIEKSRRWVSNLPFKLTAVLVGSYARGDFNLWSDIDVLLISRDFKGNPVERLKQLDIPSGFQVIPLSEKEFKTLLEKKEPLILEAAEKGIVLKDDLKLFSKSYPSNQTLPLHV